LYIQESFVCPPFPKIYKRDTNNPHLMIPLLFTLAATQLPVQTVPVFDESITFDGTVAGGISGFAAAIIASESYVCA
jgi:hypothetical protein